MILERESDLAVLRGLVDQLGSGGRMVLVRGEAGIGKSALIDEFTRQAAERAHILIGACDDLLTPQPLAPIWDVARDEPSMTEPLARDDRRGVMEGLLDLLSRRLRPTILVLEDTQWAGEATLDVIKFLGRRISRTNGLVVLTYRDGAVDTEHPLRQVIGELPPRNIVRISLERLSREAIAELVGERSLDPTEVHRLTGGNPLFVTEVLSAKSIGVPSSVQDAVLARAARVSGEARSILDLVSISPGGIERALLDDLRQPDEQHLGECVRQDLLVADAESVRFRHELQRRAIEAALESRERRDLNSELLKALSADQDAARLAHHAREANDIPAIIDHTAAAARAAVAIESHREALAHFRTLEPHLDRIPPAERADILDEWAREELLMDSPATLRLSKRAIELRRGLPDDRALARSLVFAVRINEIYGNPDDAESYAAESARILEAHPPSADLAMALGQQAWLRLMKGDDDGSGVAVADRAIEVGRAVGDDLAVARALIAKGAIRHSSIDRGAISLVEEGLRITQEGGHRFDEVYALINLGGLAGDVRDVERALDMTRRAVATAARYEIRYFEIFAQAMYSEMLLWKGDWAEAEDAANAVIGAHPHAELIALRMLGTIQARRGRPDAAELFERMWSMAAASRELQNMDPAASALAEHMWLTDDRDPARMERLQGVFDRGTRSGFVWPSGALAFWCWKLGMVTTVPARTSDFYRWIIEGDWKQAERFWADRGVPYERGLALMHGDHDARIEAVRVFEELGATATASRLRRELTAAGVRVPRGRSRATREHGAGLTARQAEVLELLDDGLTNPEIANRLFVSPRTVENHVAAILRKLDAGTREDAVAAAHDRELLA